MATTIKIKNSATPSSTPSSLEQGEMALNVTDGKLFYGSGSGNDVKEFTGGGTTIDTGSFATTGSNTFIGDQTITGSVEVTGAVTASALSSSYIDFDGTTPAYADGRLFYDSGNGALGFYNEEADVTLQIGQEFWIYGKNDSGQILPNGTPVRISGASGANMLFDIALAEDHTTSSVYDNHLIGVLTHEVGINGFGYATVEGVVRDVDTSDYAAGDILFLQTGSGGFRNDPPPFPYDIVQVGFVKRVQSQNGEIFVKVQEPVHFGNISGLSGSASEVGDLWVYQSNNAWTPTKTLSGSYTINNGGLTANSFTGSLQGNATTATTATTASYVAADNIDQPFTHITASGNISGSQTGSFAYLELPGFNFDSGVGTSELEVDHRVFDNGSSTLSSNGGSIGDIVKFGGTTTVAGAIYYLKTDGSWGAANSTDTSASTGSLAMALGTNSTTDGMLLRGLTNPVTDPSAGTGQPVYLGLLDGRITATPPSTSGNVVRIIGHQFGTDLVYFNPSNDYIVLS